MSTSRFDDERVARLVAWYEALTPATLARVGEFYAADARFKDPFNDVTGAAEIRRVFEHMFVSLHEPRFVVTEALVQGDQCMLTWDFHFRFKRYSDAPQVVKGASHLRFDAQGRIHLHRDYWDAAEELYEKLPVLGALMRWLKQRART